MSDSSELQTERALGRIEGIVEEILKEQKQLRQDFGDHKNDDQFNFSAMRTLVYKERGEVQKEIDAFKTARAILRGQLTMGQKILVYIGAIASFLITVYVAITKR